MKLVKSVIMIKSDMGIIQLIINTKDKWVNYHQYNDYTYNIQDPEAITEENSGENLMFEESLLEKDGNERYIVTHNQNKDQIIYYWIPYNLFSGKKSKNIEL